MLTIMTDVYRKKKIQFLFKYVIKDGIRNTVNVDTDEEIMINAVEVRKDQRRNL